MLSQTLRPVEVIVSDDASTDSTLAVVEQVIEEAARSAPGVRFRVLRNARPLGVTGNFEQAISACSADLIALSDQDDIWMPHRLERAAAEFARRPDLVLLGSDADLIDSVAEPLGRTLFETLEISRGERSEVARGDAYLAFMRRNLVTGATTMLRREIARTASPFPTSWVHDEWLAVIASAVGRVDLLGEPLIGYRQHASNVIGASRLGLRGKVRRVTSPRTERNARLLERARVLPDRLVALRASDAHIERAREKVRHEEARSSLPVARIRRLAPVLREIRTGRYSDYGMGFQDVVRDLVQPV
jgi:glycosyltransferase involved in cell wall biosynthesis